jgi:hypothetical protein
LNAYQCFYIGLEVLGFILIGFIFCSFSIAVCNSCEDFIKKIEEVKKEGWKETDIAFILDFINHTLSLVLLVIVFLLLPACCFFFKSFIEQVVFGALTMSQFLARVPEIFANAANFYSNCWLFLASLFHKIIS